MLMMRERQTIQVCLFMEHHKFRDCCVFLISLLNVELQKDVLMERMKNAHLENHIMIKVCLMFRRFKLQDIINLMITAYPEESLATISGLSAHSLCFGVAGSAVGPDEVTGTFTPNSFEVTLRKTPLHKQGRLF